MKISARKRINPRFKVIMNATKNCYTRKHLHRFITNKKKISHNIPNIKMQNFTKFIKQIANIPKTSSSININLLNFSYQMCGYVECIQLACQVTSLVEHITPCM